MNGIVLSKKAIRKLGIDTSWDLAFCPICKNNVVISSNEHLKDSRHWQLTHGKDVPVPGQEDPGFKVIEEFEYDPVGDSERSGRPCPKCKSEMAYYDDYDPQKGLWPYYQCEKCGHWEDEPGAVTDIETAPQGEDPGLESLFKDCPKCGAEMDIFEAETNQYWVCEKCGHNERMGEPTKPTWKDYLKPSHWLKQIKDVVGGYPKRREVLADQMTPNIWLGDVINAWVMRDKKSGKPFDAILNVSQHSYTPPEDVEYSHIPIDEYNPSKEARKKRIQDITKAAGLLDKWTQEGKKIYLHCSEGMNRSPSVLAAHLFNEQMQDAKNQGLTTDDKESLYDLVIEDIGKKRFVAMPYGEMEDSLREYLGFPPPQRRPVTKEEIDRIFQKGGPTKGGWFAPEKRPKPKFRLNEQVHWEYGNKPHTGTIISTPQFGDQGGVYWIKDQESGVVAMVKEEMLRRKKKIEPVRYYPGEKGIIQTHPKFPPPGGVGRRKKRKGFLSKGSFVKTALHGNAFRTIARFIRRAIRRDELYNFYAVMQLPPAFFAAFPKWDSYARGLVETVAVEYAEYLEQIVRTEAEETHAQLGGDDEESEHDHEWEPADDDYHLCSDCGYDEAHYGWSDADETGHTCKACGHANSHSFATMKFRPHHECTECGGWYDHNWALVGDQEYRCESTDDADGDFMAGCGAETDTIPADEEAPFYGDFWEERHQHNFQDYPITEQRGSGDAVRCNLCGRAFVDELGEVTERLPGIQKKRVT
ncbi:MAG: dual specificity protein phosphatase family protein, partial [Nitrososphaera sp.]|nr:dual specificity protein phosphatase family protein [Nitrososphaera sp.]